MVLEKFALHRLSRRATRWCRERSPSFEVSTRTFASRF
jgi:hypothetical protein